MTWIKNGAAYVSRLQSSVGGSLCYVTRMNGRRIYGAPMSDNGSRDMDWPAQLHSVAFPQAIINRNSPVEAEDTADWVGELTGWDDWKWGGG